MIYLIGGSPKCGKTTLAKRMSKLFGIPWVSTDTLQNVIKPYMNEDDFSKKFPVDYQRCKYNDEKYSKYSTKEIIEAYKQQAKTIYRAIDMFTVCEITDGNDFIIEGYHIEPELVRKLNLKYADKVKSIFLVKFDKEKFVCDIKKSTTPNDWIIARTKNKETYQKITDVICKYSNFFEKESKKYGFKTLDMDNDFDDRIKEAFDYFKPDYDQKLQQVSIKGLLCRNNKILVLKTATKKGTYELPGGRMDFGESVEEAFQREIKEELGFRKVRIGNLINTWSFTDVRNGTDHHFIMFDFEIFTNESKIKLSGEHIEYKWVEKDEFEDMDMREGHKESLRKYFKK